jgi:AAA family ATP:ADP antiporter
MADATPADETIPLLRPLVKVKATELALLAVSATWIFLALTAYYIIKPIRSTVLQKLIGVDNTWKVLLATTAFVGVFSLVYGAIVERVPRKKLVVGTFIAFVICLAGFAYLLPHGRPIAEGNRMVGYAFYVWVSTFNLMVVSQFWSVGSEVWTKEQGVRLFGAIGIGGVAGSIFGTTIVSKQAKHLATYQMLALSAVILLACLGLSLYVLSRLKAKPKEQAKKDATAENHSSIGLVLGSPYLRLIALMMLVLNLVNTNNEWILNKVLEAKHLSDDESNAFNGSYYLYQNILTFLIQSLLTARVQRAFGARGALLFEPIVGILGGLTFLGFPRLEVIRTHKIAENACDYSIQSNTRELLYVPTSPLEKYSAKNFNDTFVVRLGDALAALSIAVATNYLLVKYADAGLKMLVAFDLVLGGVWLAIAVAIGRAHAARMAEREAQPKVEAKKAEKKEDEEKKEEREEKKKPSVKKKKAASEGVEGEGDT